MTNASRRLLHRRTSSWLAISCTLLLAFVFASQGGAAVVDRLPLISPPPSTLVAARGDRIVASDTGSFLVDAQRITNDGVNVDGEPVIGAEGYAVGWRDGWMILDPEAGHITLKHLGLRGAPAPVMQIPLAGSFLAAASGHGQLAILESLREAGLPTLSLIIADEHGVIQRRALAKLSGGAVERFGDGFLVVSYINLGGADFRAVLQAWRVDANGTPVQFQSIGEFARRNIDRVAITVDGDRALVTTINFAEITAQVVDSSLGSSSPVVIASPPSNQSVVSLPVNDGFLISYFLNHGTLTDNRAVVLSREGTIVSDTAADPIAAGDHSGDSYLVMRPWGDTAIARGDPRHVVPPVLHLQRRVYEPARTLATEISGDVTLVAFGPHDFFYLSRFVRIDGEGKPVDREPLPLPSQATSITATSDGFAFGWVDDQIRVRRFTRKGPVDSQSRVISPATGVLGVAIHANGSRIIVAWTTKDQVFWQSLALDGRPLEEAPSHVARASSLNLNQDFITISGGGENSLIQIQQTYQCPFECPVPDLPLEVLALDRFGRSLGPLRSFSGAVAAARAIGLPDGTWVIPINQGPAEILHLTLEGSLLDRFKQPMLDGEIVDAQPTATGWKALVTNPLRLVELAGASQPIRLIGLSGMTSPRFAFRDLLAFLEPSPLVESVAVPWAGRLSTVEGDLAVTITRDPSARLFALAIRNGSTRRASNVFLGASSNLRFLSTGTSTVRLQDLAPGEIVRVAAKLDPGLSPEAKIFVLSDDISDLNPVDNRVVASAASPLTPALRRAARP